MDSAIDAATSIAATTRIARRTCPFILLFHHDRDDHFVMAWSARYSAVDLICPCLLGREGHVDERARGDGGLRDAEFVGLDAVHPGRRRHVQGHGLTCFDRDGVWRELPVGGRDVDRRGRRGGGAGAPYEAQGGKHHSAAEQSALDKHCENLRNPIVSLLGMAD